MLFRWMPVPGTITPEPEPVDAVSEAAFPRSSTTEMWVVPGEPARSCARPSRRSIRCRAASRLASEHSFRASPPR